eukprot:Clim_evm3s123 gene=Clim_evmTU3s123
MITISKYLSCLVILGALISRGAAALSNTPQGTSPITGIVLAINNGTNYTGTITHSGDVAYEYDSYTWPSDYANDTTVTMNIIATHHDCTNATGEIDFNFDSGLGVAKFFVKYQWVFDGCAPAFISAIGPNPNNINAVILMTYPAMDIGVPIVYFSACPDDVAIRNKGCPHPPGYNVAGLVGIG